MGLSKVINAWCENFFNKSSDCPKAMSCAIKLCFSCVIKLHVFPFVMCKTRHTVNSFFLVAITLTFFDLPVSMPQRRRRALESPGRPAWKCLMRRLLKRGYAADDLDFGYGGVRVLTKREAPAQDLDGADYRFYHNVALRYPNLYSLYGR